MKTLSLYIYGAIAAALIGLASWFHLDRVAEAKRAVHAHYAVVLGDIRQKTVDAVVAFRATETAWRDHLDEVTKDGQERIAQVRSDASGALDERDRMRNELARYRAAAKAPKDPSTPAAGSSAGDALDLLAELLAESDEMAGIYAEAADHAHAAGSTCERAYDALTRAQEEKR